MKKWIVVFSLVTLGAVFGFMLRPAVTTRVPAADTRVSLPDAVAQGRTESGTESESIRMLEKMSDAFAEVAEKANPAVVTITSERVIKPTDSGQSPFGEQNPFRDFFGDDFFRRFFEYRIPEEGIRQETLGSGVIVREDGYILTNNHLVGGAEDIVVVLSDGREFEAEIVGVDSRTDIAVVKVKGEDLPIVRLANSDDVRVGEWVVAIGNPFRLKQTVTAGIVSAKGRSNVGLAEYEDFIQTDAAINPGNSGGALVNLRGELVGINTAIATRTGTFSGVGFAIPTNMAKRVMDDLIAKGRVVRGWLGVLIQNVDRSMAEAMKLEAAGGVLVSQVVEDGPAEKAGIKRGDVIIKLNGEKVKDTIDLRNRVSQVSPGTKVELTVLRDGKMKEMDVALGELPDEKEAREMTRGAVDKLGLEVGPLTEQLAKRFGYEGEKGVIVTSVEQYGAAAQAGLAENDLIMEIDKKAVESVGEFEEAVRKLEPGETILLLVKRADSTLFVPLKLPKE